MSSPTPQSAKNIRILKREVVDRDTHRVDVAPNRIEGASEAPPGTTTEEDYAKARALIFGEDESPVEDRDGEISFQKPSNRTSGKAQYRGCDNSEYDPDYQRIPPTYVPDHYAPESAQRQVWDSRFPPLGPGPQLSHNQRPAYPRNP